MPPTEPDYLPGSVSRPRGERGARQLFGGESRRSVPGAYHDFRAARRICTLIRMTPSALPPGMLRCSPQVDEPRVWSCQSLPSTSTLPAVRALVDFSGPLGPPAMAFPADLPPTNSVILFLSDD